MGCTTSSVNEPAPQPPASGPPGTASGQRRRCMEQCHPRSDDDDHSPTDCSQTPSPKPQSSAHSAEANPLAAPAPASPPAADSLPLSVRQHHRQRTQGRLPSPGGGGGVPQGSVPTHVSSSPLWTGRDTPRSTSPGVRLSTSGRRFMIASAAAFGGGRAADHAEFSALEEAPPRR